MIAPEFPFVPGDKIIERGPGNNGPTRLYFLQPSRSNDMPNLSREDMDPGPDDAERPTTPQIFVDPYAEIPDDQIEHPDEGSGAPITVQEIKDAIAQRANDASHRLGDLRKGRDTFNRRVKLERAQFDASIKAAVAELAEAKRIANALTPRKPRTRKTTTK